MEKKSKSLRSKYHLGETITHHPYSHETVYIPTVNKLADTDKKWTEIERLIVKYTQSGLKD